MSWTKRQFIDRALTEIGLGKRSYTATTEDYTDALAVFDSMVLDWQARFKVGVGWPVADNPESNDIDQETQVPLPLTLCVWANGAAMIASQFGKQVMPKTNALANSSFKNMITFLVPQQSKRLQGGVPLGAGNRRFGINRPGNIFSPPPRAGDNHGNSITRN